jgi:N-acetylneuraminic acid mutarotase
LIVCQSLSLAHFCKERQQDYFSRTILWNINARFDIYDLSTNSWSIGVLPQNLLNPSIISYNNILYVAGGEINGIPSKQYGGGVLKLNQELKQ